ncbi:MAG: hypothetical protein L3J79_10945, partial [Candidatus Marinimicrobia bacterium]|nr:hypothetical protein [Candidatus Neomarinimicrobiota bacterium]
DRQNVRDTFYGTGEAGYDGWLATAEGKNWQSGLEDPSQVDLYNMRMVHPYNYENPRTILLGVRFFMGR